MIAYAYDTGDGQNQIAILLDHDLNRTDDSIKTLLHDYRSVIRYWFDRELFSDLKLIQRKQFDQNHDIIRQNLVNSFLQMSQKL